MISSLSSLLFLPLFLIFLSSLFHPRRRRRRNNKEVLRFTPILLAITITGCCSIHIRPCSSFSSSLNYYTVSPLLRKRSTTTTTTLLAVSRTDFLVQTTTAVATTTTLLTTNGGNDSQKKNVNVVEIPLKFLPLGGCLAVKISLYKDSNFDTRLFAYNAIVDTGSPFLTAPSAVVRQVGAAQEESELYPPTYEQYGETIDKMEWESLQNLEIMTTNYLKPIQSTGKKKKFIVGLPGDNVVEDTGGIFLGLILLDKSRPTFLQQLGYQAFCLDYSTNLLTLYQQKKNKSSSNNNDYLLIDPINDPQAMKLFDLTPYGDNIHHYGIECSSFVLQMGGNRRTIVTSSMLDRPVVAVIDSGLTGCVFSDSLQKELITKGYSQQKSSSSSSLPLQKVTGLQVCLSTNENYQLTLESHPDYWSLTPIDLPWFNYDFSRDNHPHIIAMGATFLANKSNPCKVSIDPISNRAKIEPQAQPRQ